MEHQSHNRFSLRKKMWRLLPRGERGFTILELTFVIAIFGIMATIVLFGFQGYTTKARFDNLVQDIALHVVTAQNAAINGLASTLTLTAPRYGMYFVSGATATTAATQFIYFQDLPCSTTYNNKYDATISGGCAGLSTESISNTKITTGEWIDSISYVLPLAPTYTTVPAGSSATITFTRPYPDATINICLGGGACYSSVSSVYIELATPSDSTLKKTIVVNSLGETRVYDGSTLCAYSGGAC